MKFTYLIGVDSLNNKLKELHKTLESYMEDEVPYCVTERIGKLLSDKHDSDDEKVYIHISRVVTAGEYRSALSLYDKKYESKLHSYGIFEELLFSYKKVIPGLIKEHRIRNSKGMFEQSKDSYGPTRICDKDNNIMLIRSTRWDSNKFEGKEVSYTIYIYSRNCKAENKRLENAKEAISKLKNFKSEGLIMNVSDSFEIN